MNVVKQIRVDMNHGELFKVVQRWPCSDVFRSPFSVLSFISVPVFQFCVLKFYRFEIAHLRRFRACFWGAQDLILVQLILIIQKIIKKSLSGYFLAYPPKMHYSAQQCITMYCSVNASIIHSRWVKYDP